MSKRHLLTVICLLLLTVALAAQAQAQETPPPGQATVDAAVSTLIAQTQGAPVQMNMTQTIQAALQSALTATAQAQIAALTATPTPTPVNWSNVQVASTTDIDLMAGPGATSAFLAPDGEHFAHRAGDTFCLYTGTSKGNCIELGDEFSSMDSESPRWSPDSRYLAFTEDFFRTFNDSDIWVWDTVSNELHDLTDDGTGRLNPAGDNWKDVDLLPHWLPDGRLLFLRYNRLEGQIYPPEIYTINADGSGLEKLGTIQLSDPYNDPFAIYALDVSANQLIYNHGANRESPDDGVWISDLDGGNARHIIHTEREHFPMAVDLSPDGRYVLVVSQFIALGQQAEESPLYVVNVASGEMHLIDPERYVFGAGWTPEGSGLLYVVSQPQDEAQEGLYFSDTPGKAGRLVLAGHYNIPSSLLRQSFVWGANDAVLLARSPVKGLVLAQIQR